MCSMHLSELTVFSVKTSPIILSELVMAIDTLESCKFTSQCKWNETSLPQKIK